MTEIRRGRPRAFDPAVALKQASEAFKSGGYSSTSLDDIVRATGLNRPSLYAAFGDKKSLYLAAIERLWGAIEAQFTTLEARNLPLDQTLRLIMSNSITSYVGSEGEPPRGCLAICTASAEAANDADIRKALAGVLDLLDERIAGFYARAGDNEPMRKARLIAAVLHSLSVRARAGTPRAVLEEMADEALRHLSG
jgi:TetR/AcrR family transcriptional regulator, copper-responsive repressor